MNKVLRLSKWITRNWFKGSKAISNKYVNWKNNFSLSIKRIKRLRKGLKSSKKNTMKLATITKNQSETIKHYKKIKGIYKEIKEIFKKNAKIFKNIINSFKVNVSKWKICFSVWKNKKAKSSKRSIKWKFIFPKFKKDRKKV